MCLPQKLTFVDIETTGSRVSYDRIIEIGILRVEDNELVDTYQTLINPEVYIPPFISDMTGIDTRELEDAPLFYEVKEKILELLADSIFVAHNARFDYGFLKHEFRRCGEKFSARHFCTVKLSRSLFPRARHHNLDTLIERFGIECEARHRAYPDAKVLWDFYQLAQKQFGTDTLSRHIGAALKKPPTPLHIPAKTLDALPEGAGSTFSILMARHLFISEKASIFVIASPPTLQMITHPQLK